MQRINNRKELNKFLNERMKKQNKDYTKRNKGKEARWKGAGFGDYYCSLCQEVVSGNELTECPYCGAKMK